MISLKKGLKYVGSAAAECYLGFAIFISQKHLTNRAKTIAAKEGRSIPFSELGPSSSIEEAALVGPSRFKSNGMWAVPPHRWDDLSPEKLLMRKEMIEVFKKALAGLSPSQQAIVTLRDVEGLGSNEVCKVLEISESNMRVLLHRARSKIRSALERYFAGE
ncbi:MAG: sigma-70 family RNA polymerase sigma factor [Planctomycetes bacterium]|nr:sigma-70 family RNA polymerase sigma factor [Planctomycetota bacterium]